MNPLKERYFFQAEFKKVGRVQFKNDAGQYESGVQIKGYASTSDKDRGNDVVLPEAFRETIAKDYANNPIILAQHDTNRPIGKATYMKVDEKGLYIEAVIFEEDMARMIDKGVLKTFSIGYYPTEIEYRDLHDDRVLDPTIEGDFWQIWEGTDVKRVIRKLELYEVSVVSIPMNQNALFSLAKSMKGFFNDHKEQTRLEKQPSLNPDHMKKSDNLLEKKEDEQEGATGADEATGAQEQEGEAEEPQGTESTDTAENEGEKPSTASESSEEGEGEKSPADEAGEKPDAEEEGKGADAEEEDEEDSEDESDSEKEEAEGEGKPAPTSYDGEGEKSTFGFDLKLVTPQNMKMALEEVVSLKAQVKSLTAQLASIPSKRAMVFSSKMLSKEDSSGENEESKQKSQEQKTAAIAQKQGFKDAFTGAAN